MKHWLICIGCVAIIAWAWLWITEPGRRLDAATDSSLCDRLSPASDWPAGVVEDVGSPQWLSNEDVAATSAYPAEAMRQFAQLGRLGRCERRYMAMRDGQTMVAIHTWIVGYATPAGAEAGFQMVGPQPGAHVVELPVPQIGDQAVLYLTGMRSMLVYRDGSVVIGVEVGPE